MMRLLVSARDAAEALAAREADAGIAAFTEHVRSEARRRTAELRGRERIARHAVAPQTELVAFTNATAEQFAEMRRAVQPLSRKLATRLAARRRRAAIRPDREAIRAEGRNAEGRSEGAGSARADPEGAGATVPAGDRAGPGQDRGAAVGPTDAAANEARPDGAPRSGPPSTTAGFRPDIPACAGASGRVVRVAGGVGASATSVRPPRAWVAVGRRGRPAGA